MRFSEKRAYCPPRLIGGSYLFLRLDDLLGPDFLCIWCSYVIFVKLFKFWYELLLILSWIWRSNFHNFVSLIIPIAIKACCHSVWAIIGTFLSVIKSKKLVNHFLNAWWHLLFRHWLTLIFVISKLLKSLKLLTAKNIFWINREFNYVNSNVKTKGIGQAFGRPKSQRTTFSDHLSGYSGAKNLMVGFARSCPLFWSTQCTGHFFTKNVFASTWSTQCTGPYFTKKFLVALCQPVVPDPILRKKFLSHFVPEPPPSVPEEFGTPPLCPDNVI